LTVYRLTDDLVFPPPGEAEDNGLLAVGGDLRPERVLLAYASGIFPWPHEGYPLLWFSPDPRSVLPAGKLRVSRRLVRRIRNAGFRISLDRAFPKVIEGCARAPRRGEPGTWITPGMIETYTVLHEAGFVHSAECWHDDQLAGGVYGVSIGGIFIGESMFARVPDASKVALVTLVRQLERWGIDLLDAQIRTEHVARFGAEDWPRDRYLAWLREAVRQPTRRGPWELDPDLENGPRDPA
jgi:leucyl/phenylalanyl-tRNA--protein transferase